MGVGRHESGAPSRAGSARRAHRARQSRQKTPPGKPGWLFALRRKSPPPWGSAGKAPSARETQSPIRQGWRRPALMVACGGSLLGLCWLPVLPAALYPIGFLLQVLALERARTGRDALWLGLLNGAARYAVAGHFLLALLRYSPLAIAFYLLAIAYILPFAALESWGAFWLRRRAGLPLWLSFAILWSLGEKLRTLGDLSFPADLLAHGFGDAPAWLAPTAWTGPFAVPLWVGAIAAAALLGWRALAVRRWTVGLAALAATLAVFVSPLVVDRWQRESEGGGGSRTASLRVGVVQPFASFEEKVDRRRWDALWERMVRLTRRVSGSSDLIVWPESARPSTVAWREQGRFGDRRVHELVQEIRRPILYGAELFCLKRGAGRGAGELYNGAALMPGLGGNPQWYGKQRLLPFAEGIPFAQLVGWDPSKRRHSGGNLTMLGNFTRGPRPTVFRVGSARIGVLICFEGFYPDLARRYRQQGANVLAVLTNDAWWGRSVFGRWHDAMIGARAREVDLPVIRAANSGISSIRTRRGEVIDQTRLGETAVLQAGISPSSTVPTFYSRHGDWFIGLELLLLAGALAGALLRRGSAAGG